MTIDFRIPETMFEHLLEHEAEGGFFVVLLREVATATSTTHGPFDAMLDAVSVAAFLLAQMRTELPEGELEMMHMAEVLPLYPCEAP